MTLNRSTFVYKYKPMYSILGKQTFVKNNYKNKYMTCYNEMKTN